MSIYQGSFSICRYKIIGREGPLKISGLNKKLKAHQSTPVSLGSENREIRVGWVRPLNADNVDLPEGSDWNMSDCREGNGFMLRIRIEKRKVPGQLLQIMIKERVFKEISANGGEEIGRKHRKAIKEEVKEELLGSCLPQISHIDAYWNEDLDEVWLFSTAKSARETFERLFASTFGNPLGLGIIHMTAPLIGLDEKEWQDPNFKKKRMQRLSRTVPTAFAQNNL